MDIELLFKKLRDIGFNQFSGANHNNILSFRFLDGDAAWKSNIFEFWFRSKNGKIPPVQFDDRSWLFYWWISGARLHPSGKTPRIDEGKKENLTEAQMFEALDQKINEYYL